MSLKNGKSVYVLYESYKNGDRDLIGAYDSLNALAIGFSERVTEEVLGGVTHSDGNISKRKALENALAASREVARVLLPLLDPTWPGCEDECRIGDTVYGYCELPLISVEKESQWLSMS